MNPPRPCAYCGTTIGVRHGLCAICLLGLIRYPDENQVIFDAYVADGLSELEAMLAHPERSSP